MKGGDAIVVLNNANAAAQVPFPNVMLRGPRIRQKHARATDAL